MISESTLTRRRFLVFGAAVGVAACGTGCGLFDRDSSENPWEAVFGDAMAGVLVIGRGAVERGIVPDEDAARAALPDDVPALGSGFDRSFHELVDEQLLSGELVEIEGYPFVPAEAALAALVYLDEES